MKSRTIRLPNQMTLPYVEQGEVSGPPMLFLHGFSGSLYSFEPVLVHLPPSIHAFALTQRGHGDASKPKEGYTLDVFATDAVAFMDAVGIDSAIVVGHSMGSAVALRVALDYPKRVRALVLFGAGMLAQGGPKEQAFWETTVSELRDPVASPLVRGFLETVYARPIPEERFESTLRNILKVPARVWRAIWKGRLEGKGMSGDLSEIGVPTLIIWGDQDIRCTRAEQDALLAALPNSRLEIYQGVGHGPHAEVPERLAFTRLRREAVETQKAQKPPDSSRRTTRDCGNQRQDSTLHQSTPAGSVLGKKPG